MVVSSPREIKVAVFPLGQVVVQVTPICTCRCEDYVSHVTITRVSCDPTSPVICVSHDRKRTVRDATSMGTIRVVNVHATLDSEFIDIEIPHT